MGDEAVEVPSVEAGAEESEEVAQEGPEVPDLASTLVGFDSRLAESQRLLARQQDLTERLHAENQALRAGEVRAAQAPLVRGLLRLYDDVGWMRAAAGGEGDDDLRVVQESLADVLARNGIEAFTPGVGEPFDSALHSASGVEPTGDPALDRTVAEILRPGFRWEAGEVIRVAEVRAYRHSGDG